jgi:hypothetical protein
MKRHSKQACDHEIVSLVHGRIMGDIEARLQPEDPIDRAIRKARDSRAHVVAADLARALRAIAGHKPRKRDDNIPGFPGYESVFAVIAMKEIAVAALARLDTLIGVNLDV